MDIQVADNPKPQFNSFQGPQVMHEAVSTLKSILRPDELQDENIESPAGILRIIETKLQDKFPVPFRRYKPIDHHLKWAETI